MAVARATEGLALQRSESGPSGRQARLPGASPALGGEAAALTREARA
jgi:hypothetical protein